MNKTRIELFRISLGIAGTVWAFVGFYFFYQFICIFYQRVMIRQPFDNLGMLISASILIVIYGIFSGLVSWLCFKTTKKMRSKIL